ncbi:MAG TPA: hypothetical protein VK196_09805 [Magnetospirillum sp.]|nr:hypothetical protein [Magnetospirillum sp.]
MGARWAVVLPLLAAAPALSQEQQARAPERPTGAGEAIFDMVAGDRETAWRLNRVTGEILVCRIDTTGSLDSPKARCAPVTHETPAQQSQAPQTRAPQGGTRP